VCGASAQCSLNPVNFREITVGHERLVRELNEERAAALVRIGRVLESLIDELHALRQRIGPEHDVTETSELVRYRDVHQRALLYRWFLEVQREAVGLRQHHILDEVYVIPGPL
jgi:hypothetical protein